MKDYIKEVQHRYYERMKYHPNDCDSSWVIDMHNLLALVKAYEKMAEDEQDGPMMFTMKEIKKQIFEKETTKG